MLYQVTKKKKVKKKQERLASGDLHMDCIYGQFIFVVMSRK